jgi:glutamine amidotransferase
MQTVAVIDYGMSNLRSVARALEHVGAGAHRIIVTDRPAQIESADRVVFPGQGAIGQCMDSLRSHGLVEILRTSLESKPFLGICLGLQSLMDWSDEDGGVACLGVLPGQVVRFAEGLRDATDGMRLKIPHMGWNQVTPTGLHPLWTDIVAGERFYFVHSYYVRPVATRDTAATTNYGVEFTCACARGNIFATQFHPEKSQKAGLQLLANFLRWEGE